MMKMFFKAWREDKASMRKKDELSSARGGPFRTWIPSPKINDDAKIEKKKPEAGDEKISEEKKLLRRVRTEKIAATSIIGILIAGIIGMIPLLIKVEQQERIEKERIKVLVLGQLQKGELVTPSDLAGRWPDQVFFPSYPTYQKEIHLVYFYPRGARISIYGKSREAPIKHVLANEYLKYLHDDSLRLTIIYPQIETRRETWNERSWVIRTRKSGKAAEEEWALEIRWLSGE